MTAAWSPSARSSARLRGCLSCSPADCWDSGASRVRRPARSDRQRVARAEDRALTMTQPRRDAELITLLMRSVKPVKILKPCLGNGGWYVERLVSPVEALQLAGEGGYEGIGRRAILAIRLIDSPAPIDRSVTRRSHNQPMESSPIPTPAPAAAAMQAKLDQARGAFAKPFLSRPVKPLHRDVLERYQGSSHGSHSSLAPHSRRESRQVAL